MFSSKMVILKGIWTFLLSRYHITVETSDDPLSLDHLVISGYASHGAHGAHGHQYGCGRLGPIRLHLVIFSDVATTAIFIWQLHYAVNLHIHEASGSVPMINVISQISPK